MTNEQDLSPEQIRRNLVLEFLSSHSDKNHRIILDAYGGSNPVEAMEAKLREILEGIAADED